MAKQNLYRKQIIKIVQSDGSDSHPILQMICSFIVQENMETIFYINIEF